MQAGYSSTLYTEFYQDDLYSQNIIQFKGARVKCVLTLAIFVKGEGVNKVL